MHLSILGNWFGLISLGEVRWNLESFDEFGRVSLDGSMLVGVSGRSGLCSVYGCWFDVQGVFVRVLTDVLVCV